jgi:hypothetical protein
MIRKPGTPLRSSSILCIPVFILPMTACPPSLTWNSTRIQIADRRYATVEALQLGLHKPSSNEPPPIRTPQLADKPATLFDIACAGRRRSDNGATKPAFPPIATSTDCARPAAPSSPTPVAPRTRLPPVHAVAGAGSQFPMTSPPSTLTAWPVM